MNKEEKWLVIASLLDQEETRLEELSFIEDGNILSSRVEEKLRENRRVFLRKGLANKGFTIVAVDEDYKEELLEKNQGEIEELLFECRRRIINGNIEELNDDEVFFMVVNSVNLTDRYDEDKLHQFLNEGFLELALKTIGTLIGNREKCEKGKKCYGILLNILYQNVESYNNAKEWLYKFTCNLIDLSRGDDTISDEYEILNRVIPVFKEEKSIEKAMLLILLGNNFKSQKECESSIEAYKRGIGVIKEIYGTKEDEDKLNLKKNYYDISGAFIAMGKFYKEAGEHKKAAICFKDGCQVFKYTVDKYNFFGSYLYWQSMLDLVGELDAIGDYEEALKYADILTEKEKCRFSERDYKHFRYGKANKKRIMEIIKDKNTIEGLDVNAVSSLYISSANYSEKPLFDEEIEELKDIKVKSFENIEEFFEEISFSFNGEKYIEELNSIDVENEGLEDFCNNSELRILGVMVDDSIILKGEKIFEIEEDFDYKMDEDFIIYEAVYKLKVVRMKDKYKNANSIVVITSLGDDILGMDKGHEINIWVNKK